MIKANELRIGNLVMRNNKFDGLPRVTKIIGMMIFQAEKEPDEFEPIPLTPEWLERLGFIQGRQNADRNLFYATGAHAAIYSISLSGGVMLHRADIKMLLEQHVEYVHQLQNLYFALSNGQELTVKEMA